MKIYSMFAVLLMSLGLQVFALPAVQVGSKETGITTNPDGSKTIGGPNGITTNAQGQTTNVGGKGGISIIPSASNTTAEAPKKQPKPSGAGNSTDALAALLGAAQGKNSSGTTVTGGNRNTTAGALPPGVDANSTLGGIFGALMGAGK